MKNQTYVEHWVSMLAQYRYETENFRLSLHRLTDAELLHIKPVTLPFLDLAPRMLEIVKPKHAAEFRRAIAYLSDLYERQSLAQERETARLERRQTELNRVVKILNNAPMTNQEKINLVNQHYGWE